jgi:hypothetical protein
MQCALSSHGYIFLSVVLVSDELNASYFSQVVKFAVGDAKGFDLRVCYS